MTKQAAWLPLSAPKCFDALNNSETLFEIPIFNFRIFEVTVFCYKVCDSDVQTSIASENRIFRILAVVALKT